LAGQAGHLGRPCQNLGVAGALGEIDPCFDTNIDVAALQGKFAEQGLENRTGENIFR
jgi:hypothetical protein